MCIASGSHVGQQRPVFLADFDHVVQAGIVLIGHFSQAKVRALASVRRDHIVDDHRIVRGSHARQGLQLRLGAQLRVDVEADAVEIAVDGRGVLGARQATRLLQRAVVNALDADLGQGMPQGFVPQRLQHGAAFAGDNRGGVGREPHRRQGRSVTRPGLCIGLLPQAALPRIELGPLPRCVEHGMLHQPVHMVVVRRGHKLGTCRGEKGRCKHMRGVGGIRCIDLASSKCGRGLAPDGGGSDKNILTDTLLSGASPLPH
ncbi:hypothetical protein PFLmoz3_05441 [Pseudomonas fluorescens]|uniref:Uncharacterized protein n=1 Tax=Pseudomonas fluorescens TaxID=294 RepID=A0A109LCA7_PSEFL|nr:hypothetical protein PFLmoz3_05441 [Pseudomonas fluorescens]